MCPGASQDVFYEAYNHKTAQVCLNGFTNFLDMTFKVQLIFSVTKIHVLPDAYTTVSSASVVLLVYMSGHTSSIYRGIHLVNH